jgi:starch phosphorylase
MTVRTGGASRHAESQVLLDIIEDQVIPLYYSRNGHGFPEGWIKRSKASMKTVMPRFNAVRMMRDYVINQYVPASLHGTALAADDAAARDLAGWKKRVAEHWNEVGLRRLDEPVAVVEAGDTLNIRVAVKPGPFSAQDIVVECLLGACTGPDDFEPMQHLALSHTGMLDSGEMAYELALEATMSGLQCYKIRAYPHHEAMANRFESGRMRWL